jgi:hypothetical protein
MTDVPAHLAGSSESSMPQRGRAAVAFVRGAALLPVLVVLVVVGSRSRRWLLPG